MCIRKMLGKRMQTASLCLEGRGLGFGVSGLGFGGRGRGAASSGPKKQRLSDCHSQLYTGAQGPSRLFSRHADGGHVGAT